MPQRRLATMATLCGPLAWNLLQGYRCCITILGATTVLSLFESCMCVKHAVNTLRMYEDCQQVSKGIWVESSNQVHYAVDSWYFAQIGSLGMYQKHLYANYLCFVRRCWSIVQMLGVWLFCAPWHLYRRVPVSSCIN